MATPAGLAAAIEDDDGVLVAFSGGVDSTVLAAVAHRVQGDDALAVTFETETMPRRELEDARALAAEIGIRHRVEAYSELASDAYRDNDADRCYHCRVMLGDKLRDVADREGLDAIVAGIVPRDLDDHSPGVAALREAGVRFPYVETGTTKAEIRELARDLDLPVHDKPTEACLSSRIPYGDEVTEAKLERIEAAEDRLHELGFEGVRVRHHGELAQIEVRPDDRDRLLERAREVTRALREEGYTWVAMDLLGYRTGAMNEGLRVVN